MPETPEVEKFREGFNACARGGRIYDNPYPHWSWMGVAWSKGWKEHDCHLADRDDAMLALIAAPRT